MKVASGNGRVVQTLNIPDDGQTSEAIEIPSDMRLVAIQFPASVDATSLTFTGSVSGVTYVAINDPSGVAVSATIASSKYVLMPELSGIPFLKLALGTQQTTGTAGIDLGLVFEKAASGAYPHAGAVFPTS